MWSGLPQDLLDELASAWLRLDGAKPTAFEDVPHLLEALTEWMRWAIRVEDEVLGILAVSYLTHRAVAEGGAALPGLRHAHELVRGGGHSVDELVTVSAASPPTYLDVMWRQFDELPRPAEDAPAPAGESAYRLHLEGLAARVPAADVTRFLLHTVLDWQDDDPAGATGPAEAAGPAS
jgi:hypothetical protein